MAGENLNTAGGGLHPGRPVIWPTGKNAAQSEQVSQSKQAQTAGGVRGVPVQTAKTSSATSATMAAQASATSAAQTAANVARALTTADIKQHLLNIQIPDTDVNMHLAQLMLKHGLELSRSNFVKLMNMMEGTNMSTNVQEAAIALLLKGIDSPEALTILTNYFTQNPEMAAQLMALQESIGSLQGALGMGKAALSSQLLSQIAAMLTQFDELLKGLPGNYKFSENNSISRDGLVNDVRALKALLEGLQEKTSVQGGGESEILSAGLSSSIGKLDSVLQNLVAQAIMSQNSDRQEVNYQFYQIPNAMVTPPKNMEVIVKKDSSGNAAIDPNDTQIIMSIDTHNMGKISLVLRVKDKKVSLLFNTEAKDIQNLIIRESGELKQKMMDQDYVAEGFQVKVNPTMCNIRPYLIPMIGLDDLLKINVEA
jgi:hypothetical protein